VNCPEHGPTVAQVPWARHGAGHTRDFDGLTRIGIDEISYKRGHFSGVPELCRSVRRSR